MNAQVTESATATPKIEGSGTTLRWIDIAKGIGILLVVVGHFYPKDSPAYWVTLRTAIYEFHMPLFFLLAGYLVRDVAIGNFRHFVAKKSQRLLLPFLTAATAISVLKLAAQQFVALDFPVSTQSLLALLLCPSRSPAPLLWFVYTLFLMFCLLPIAYLLVARNVLMLFLASLVAAEVIHAEAFCLTALAANFPFFVFGFAAATSPPIGRVIRSSPRNGLLVAALGFLLLNIPSEALPKTLKLVSIAQGLAGSLFVIYIAKCVERMRYARVIEKMGQFSMGIYLFHTIFESGAKILLGKLLVPLLGFNVAFPIIAVASILLGITVPTLLEQHILRRFRLTRVFVLGTPSTTFR